MTVLERVESRAQCGGNLNHRPPIRRLSSTRRLQARLSNAATVAISPATPVHGNLIRLVWALEPDVEKQTARRRCLPGLRQSETPSPKQRRYRELICQRSPPLGLSNYGLLHPFDRALGLLATTPTELWPFHADLAFTPSPAWL